jgi:ATP adenylyltransferase
MGMRQDNLWAPWRLPYIKGLDTFGNSEGNGGACFFCEAAQAGLSEQQATAHLVLLRDDRGVLMLNRFPYTNGHLLAAPLEHVGDLNDLAPTQRAGLMELAAFGQRLLIAAMSPQGINLGMNLGRCAGAGVPGHIHMHVVPRWNGDVNFMHVVGGVRVIPQALEESFQSLKEMMAKGVR